MEDSHIQSHNLNSTRLLEDSPIQCFNQTFQSEHIPPRKIHFQQYHQPNNEQQFANEIYELKTSIASKEQKIKQISVDLLKINRLDPRYIELHQEKRNFAKSIIDQEYQLALLERQREIFCRNRSALRVEDEDQIETQFDNLQRIALLNSAIREAPEEEEESLIRKSEINRLNDCFSDKIRQSIRNSHELQIVKENQNPQKKSTENKQIQPIKSARNYYRSTAYPQYIPSVSMSLRNSYSAYDLGYGVRWNSLSYLASDEMYRMNLERLIYLDHLSYDYLSARHLDYY